MHLDLENVSLDTGHETRGIEIKFYNLDTFKKHIDVNFIDRSIYYGDPQLSRENQKPHGKKKNTSQQNRKPHDKNKNLTTKTKTSRQKQNTSRQNKKRHGKTKDLTAKPNIWKYTIHI